MVRAARKNSRRPPFPRTVEGIAEFFRRAQLGIPFFMRGLGKAKSGGRAQSAALPEQGSKAPRFAAVPVTGAPAGVLGAFVLGLPAVKCAANAGFAGGASNCRWGSVFKKPSACYNARFYRQTLSNQTTAPGSGPFCLWQNSRQSSAARAFGGSPERRLDAPLISFCAGAALFPNKPRHRALKSALYIWDIPAAGRRAKKQPFKWKSLPPLQWQARFAPSRHRLYSDERITFFVFL